MKDIRFRAWDNVENKMIYCGEDSGYSFHLDGTGIGGYNLDLAEFNDPMDSMEHLKYMQYTGLKDKEGNDIYEGDVCRVGGEESYSNEYITTSEDWECIFTIQDSDEGYFLRAIDDIDFQIPLIELNGGVLDFMIIGNIYENPELLEGEIE